MKPKFSEETKAAMNAALEAAKISMHYLNREKSIREKAARNLVTIADVKCENKIKEILAKKFPDYGFLGEESPRVEKGAKFWAVDPIDGTHNYSARIPIFCHSIALVDGKTPILGVIYDPTRKEMYAAEKGKGACLNNEKIHVSKRKLLKDCIIGSGFPYSEGITREKTLKSISSLVGTTLGFRRLGSAALDLSYVASGLFDAIFFYELQPWDVAAGMLIVEEAGGIATDINGNRADVFSGHFAVSNSAIHSKLLEKLVRM